MYGGWDRRGRGIFDASAGTRSRGFFGVIWLVFLFYIQYSIIIVIIISLI